MKILGISGSLRVGSSNTAIVQAAARLVPDDCEFTIYNGLGELPHYSPELDEDDLSASVLELRRLLREADAVLICTPEYAHGMPGSLKNALDWVVSSGELDQKLTAAISASPSVMGGDKALSWLMQTLTVLGAKIPEAASFTIPYVRSKFDANGELPDPAIWEALKLAIESLKENNRDRSYAVEPILSVNLTLF